MSDNKALIALGLELKKLREEKGITLNDIYFKTRIDIEFLKSIELGQFNVMPEVYLKAFIKEFAANLDLDPNEYLLKYENAKKGILPSDVSIKNELGNTKKETNTSVVSEPSFTTDGNSENDDFENNTKNLYSVFLPVALIIIASLIIYFVFFNDGKIIIEKKSSGNLNSSDEIVLEETKDELFNDSLTLRIEVSDTVWMRYIADNLKNEEMILNPNRKKTIKFKDNLNLLTGNAGAVKLYLNDTLLSHDGKSNKVKNFKITSRGLEKD